MRTRFRDFKDYYEILQVPETAREPDIKKSYRKLALKYHPDQNKDDPQAEDKFKDLTEAYGVLMNPLKRAEYNRFREAHLSGKGANDSEFRYSQEDIFANMFREGFGADIFEELNREFSRSGFRSGVHFFGPVFFGGAVGGLGRILGMFPGPLGKVGFALRLAQMLGVSLMTMQKMARKTPSPDSANGAGKQAHGTPFINKMRGALGLDASPDSLHDGLDISFSLTLDPAEALTGTRKKISYKNADRTESLLVRIPPKIQSGGKLRLKEKGRQKNGRQGDLILTVNVNNS